MKTIIVYLSLLLSSFAISTLEAQDKNSPLGKEKYLEKEKKEIILQEKEQLKQSIEIYNSQLENKIITAEEAQQKKEEAAKKHAKNIENRIAILENEVALNERNGEGRYIALGEDGKAVNLHLDKNDTYDKRTTQDLVLAAGFNNALQSGQSLNDSEFRIGGSRFFEIGWAWKTRVFKNTNWLRFRYGLSFQFDGLKPTGNRVFVEQDDITRLEEFKYDLNKSKFRMDKLVVPVFFELGPSSKKETAEKIRYSTAGKLKLGLGAFAGLNIGERQKLKYRLDGDRKKVKDKSDFNTNEFVYGLSAYLGWGGAALYAKYDLNPIFSSPNVELHNVSLGLRFDMD